MSICNTRYDVDRFHLSDTDTEWTNWLVDCITVSIKIISVSGKAEVECGENTIEVVFLTEQVFQGRVYVVGHANEPECQSRDTGRRTTSITIPKDKCSVVTTRSVYNV
jgi:hypothetical protein